MAETDIQIVSNESGEEKFASERETAYLLKSETMRQRLLTALNRTNGTPLDYAVNKLNL